MTSRPGVTWKKRILVPFWIFRILAMVFLIAVYGWAISLSKNRVDFDPPVLGVIVVFMLLIVAVLLLDVLAIVLFLRDALNPKSFLIMNSFQTGFWAGVLILDVVSIARGENAVGIIFTVIIFLSFVVLLVYASINYHKARKQAQRGNYVPALNPSAAPVQSAFPSPYGVPAPYQQDTQYHGQVHGAHEMHGQSAPIYEDHGAAAEYYSGQPVKPAQIV